jgi:serine/threonine protein kinase
VTDNAFQNVPGTATAAATDQRDELTEAALRRVGQILKGKWRLDSLLGVGGTAAVYAATHRNGNRVAIKILHAHVSMDSAVMVRLQQEGYAANLVEHPGAVRILDDDRAEDGSIFLVMELLLGEGLDMRLRRKGWQLPEAEVLGIAFCLLEVLAAAHDKGVIHRDIKPDNIFLTREGHIKVLDFGIARLLEAPEGVPRPRPGALFGTLGFMAPEQAVGATNEIGPTTDLWAVGATMFTLLTGRVVHEAVSPNEQLLKAATSAAPPLALMLPMVNPALAMIVDRALAFDRAHRWQSALEMQNAVRALAEATAGPYAQPILQGPRLSVELDLLEDKELRPWQTPHIIRASGRDLYPPTMVMPRRARPWKTIAAVALVASFAVGVFLQRSLLKVSSRASAATAVAIPGAPVPVTEAAAATKALPLATTPPAPQPVTSRLAKTPEPTATESAKTEAGATDRPLTKLARGRASRAGGRANARLARRAGARSINDDALWGRRH